MTKEEINSAYALILKMKDIKFLKNGGKYNMSIVVVILGDELTATTPTTREECIKYFLLLKRLLIF